MKNERGKKIIAILLFILASILFYTFSPKGQGDLTFKVAMDKNQAINNAKNLAMKYNWPISNSMQAAVFSIDEKAQTYFELEVGNYKKLNTLIQQEKGYIPAIWTSSIIPKDKKEKIDIYFTPSGKAYGFNIKVPEDEKGPALVENAARQIAEREAFKNWNISFDEYKLIDKGKKTLTNGRVDYTFDYERNKSIGEAKDKVELQVYGDKLTRVKHYLDIPETFSRRYEERRSSNDTIANVSFIAFYILIFIIGFFCFFYLSKRKMVLWKKALIFSSVIVLITLFSGITELKQSLINIDTSYYTPQLYFIITIITILLTALLTAVFTFTSMMVGEGLSRKAFPKHPHFWKIFFFRNMGSWQFLDRVIIAYIFVVCMLIYETLFYGTMNHLPGWWQPASMISDPNIATSWFAWIKGFGEALNAGFFEEFAFRAIPISLGVLIGEKFNKRRLGIVLAFIFEILMFSAGHANYPGFPAYARLVELLLVAFGFGMMFYFFGIIPGIIAHFTYDFILMNMTIMTTSGASLIYQKILIVFIVLLPILLALYGRYRNRRWIDLEADSYNYSHQGIDIARINYDEITDKEESEDEDEKKLAFSMGKNKKMIICMISILILVVAIYQLFNVKTVIPSFNIDKKTAEKLAKEELKNDGFILSGDWKIISDTEPENLGNAYFINENEGFSEENFIGYEGVKKYKSLIGSYINPTTWRVRFIRVKGNVDERTEEYNVFIGDKNKIINVQHILPKNKEGINLTKEKARNILDNAIRNKYGIDSNNLKEIAANEIKLNKRTDWSFTLEDNSIKLKTFKPEINAVVSGNEILNMNRTVQPPETIKSELFKKNTYKIFIAIVFILPLISIIIITSIKSIIAWTKEQISKNIFVKIFTILLVLNLAEIPLNISTVEMGLSNAAPMGTQLITIIALSIIGKIILAFFESSIIAYSKSFYRKPSAKNQIGIIISVTAAILIFLIGGLFTKKPILTLDSSISYAVGSYIKYVSQIIDTINSFIRNLAVLLIITVFLKKLKNRYIEAVLAILLFFPVSLVTLNNVLSISRYLAAALICIIYILCYYYLFKVDITLTTVAAGTAIIMSNLRAVALNQFPALNLSIASSIVVLIGFIFYNYELLSRKFESH